MDLKTILHQALEPATIAQANAQLDAFKAQNLQAYLMLCVQELTRPDSPGAVRQLAGTQIKLALSPQTEAGRRQAHELWLAIDPTVRQQMKTAVLQGLLDNDRLASMGASLVVASVAGAELPVQQWPELLDQLITYCLNATVAHVKKASLQALGYICADCGDALEERAPHILVAVVNNMRKEQPDNEIRLAAVDAFINALSFVHKNFEQEEDCMRIMGAVMEGLQDPVPDLRLRFFMSLVEIAYLYYRHLSPYMMQLYQLTLIAIVQDKEELIQIQAVEFWSQICEEENQLGAVPENRSYVRGALDNLVQVLCQALTNPISDPDPDANSIHVAAATCLAMVAVCVGDEVVRPLHPYANAHLQSADPRLRKAATMAFGSILEGPQDALKDLLLPACQIFLMHLSDTDVHVRETAAWALGRMALYHAESLKSILNLLIPRVVQGLTDSPTIAQELCWTLHNLAEQYKPEDPDEVEDTNLMSPYFAVVVQHLMAVGERTDDPHHKLRAYAYEAIGQLIACSALDMQAYLLQLLPAIVDRVLVAFQHAQQSQINVKLMGYLCGVLYQIFLKLPAKEGQVPIAPHADKAFAALLSLSSHSDSTLQEEVLMALGTFAQALGEHFAVYMTHFFPFHRASLINYEVASLCGVAVAVLGDVCAALGERIATVASDYVVILLELLAHKDVHMDVKPRVVGALGDVALALGAQFVHFVPNVMSSLALVTRYALDAEERENEDMKDYIALMRTNLFMTWTIIVQGMALERQAAVLEPYVPTMMSFVETVWRDSDLLTPELKRVSILMLGDLGSSLPLQVKPLLLSKSLQYIITAALNDKETAVANAAGWVQKIATKQ